MDLKEYLYARKIFIENGVPEDIIDDFMKKLHRYEATLHRISENACNRELTENEKRKQSRTEIHVRLLKIDLLQNWNFEFNHDPRGACIKIYLPSKKYNSWDGESFRVHW